MARLEGVPDLRPGAPSTGHQGLPPPHSTLSARPQEQLPPPRGVSGQPEVPPVTDRQASGLHKAVEAAPGTEQHVVDNFRRRCDLAVAVMPGKLQQLDQVESGGRVLFAEHIPERRLPLRPSSCSPDRHPPNCALR